MDANALEISMAIDARSVVLFVPPGLIKFKLELFNRIANKIEVGGGRVVRHDLDQLRQAAIERTPIVGCTPALRPLIDEWIATGRTWIYWDRGYCRRIFSTDLPLGTNGGYYRWHLNAYQMRSIRNLPDDRWRSLRIDPWPWHKGGSHIVFAEPTVPYTQFHRIEGWMDATLAQLRTLTDRPIRTRIKENQRSGRKLHQDLAGAHCLVTHGSNAAVEAAIMGCPVFVDPCSAAALVGQTDFTKIETPIYPDRQPWLNALAYSQFNETELVDGTLFRLIN